VNLCPLTLQLKGLFSKLILCFNKHQVCSHYWIQLWFKRKTKWITCSQEIKELWAMYHLLAVALHWTSKTNSPLTRWVINPKMLPERSLIAWKTPPNWKLNQQKTTLILTPVDSQVKMVCKWMTIRQDVAWAIQVAVKVITIEHIAQEMWLEPQVLNEVTLPRILKRTTHHATLRLRKYVSDKTRLRTSGKKSVREAARKLWDMDAAKS